jgi:hypothetical protein
MEKEIKETKGFYLSPASLETAGYTEKRPISISCKYILQSPLSLGSLRTL